MSENRELRVYTPFRSLRIDEANSGGYSGLGNVKGYIDTHGTLMADGCYLRCLQSLKDKGFACNAHGAAYMYNYPMDAVIGYFTDVQETKEGLLIEAVFHSDPASQNVRTKLAERYAAKKESGMSIGFFIRDYIRILPQDYAEELPKYSAPEYLQFNLERANTLPYVDICTEIDVFEVSLTLIPSNEVSTVAEVRSGTPNSIRTILTNLYTIMAETNTRSGRKLAKETYDKLSGHLDDLDAKCDELDSHHSDGKKLAKEMRGKSRDIRKMLDSLAKRDDDDDEKEDKRSRPVTLADIEALLKK